MRFLAILALAAGLAPANALSLFGNDPEVLRDDDPRKVPGSSPLQFCSEDRSGDILEIREVDLTPNPPEAGQTLSITAVGAASKDIEDGAYVNLQVKYGLIRLVNTKADLCKQIGNVDLECPIEKGLVSIKKDVDLPKEIPPGKYTVEADVYSKDDEHITCLTATVVFGRTESSSFLDL
ncbi:hypothetical protein VTK73DRAFT_5831 [Phialemonium thermophilum]|uniref:Phosphatidylglycerol/phosphatidylinositol transfer protein n=1 Tax=Phialemonium thermophilum TaxID=223376 RepID=A0ABR3WLJ8_9PEZI